MVRAPSMPPPQPLAVGLVLFAHASVSGCRFGYDTVLGEEVTGRSGATGGARTGLGEAGGADSADDPIGGVDGGGTGEDTGGTAGGGAGNANTGTGGVLEDATGGSGSGGIVGCPDGPLQSPEKLDGLMVENPSSPSLSSDGLTLYLGSRATGDEDIYMSTRTDRGTKLSPAIPVSELNTDGDDGTPWISADGLELFFYSDRSGTMGGKDLMQASRTSVDQPFGDPQWMENVNSSGDDYGPLLSPDGLELFFSSNRSDGLGEYYPDLWVARRGSLGEDFSAPRHLTELNTLFREDGAALSPDGLTLYFASSRPDNTNTDIWFASRPSVEEPFGAVEAFTEANSEFPEIDPYLSWDGWEFLFGSNRADDEGERDLYRILRTCEGSD